MNTTNLSTKIQALLTIPVALLFISCAGGIEFRPANSADLMDSKFVDSDGDGRQDTLVTPNNGDIKLGDDDADGNPDGAINEAEFELIDEDDDGTFDHIDTDEDGDADFELVNDDEDIADDDEVVPEVPAEE